MADHNIGATIAELRKAKGWTQAELAEKLNVTYQAVSRWEQNRCAPSIDFFPRFAELFDVTIDYLMTGKTPVVETVTLSPLESAVKADDVEQLKQMGFDNVKKAYEYRTENDKSLMDFVFQYESKKIFTWVDGEFGPLCPYKSEKQSFEFFANYYYMCLLCNVKDRVEELMLRGYLDADGNGDARPPQWFSEENISKIERFINRNDILQNKPINYSKKRYDYKIPFAVINDKMIDYILYDERMDKELRKTFLSTRQWEYGAFRYVAFVYPQLVTRALKKKDYAMVEQLIKTAIDNSKQLGEAEIYTWATNNRDDGYFREVVHNVRLTDELYNTLLEEGKFDLLDLANQFDKRVDEYTIKIYKNKHSNMSEREQKLQAAIHGDVVCLDELIAINDFELYEKTIEKYPISIWELITRVAETGEEFDLSKYTIDANVSACLRNPPRQDIRETISVIESCAARCNLDSIRWDLGQLYRNSHMGWRIAEFNYKYIAVYFNKPLAWLKPNIKGSPIAVKMTPYECFAQAKQYLFLNEVLDKDVKFIEKACKSATQKELNAALGQINPEYFEGIKVLLDAGAMLQRVCGDDECSWMQDDPISTAVLKRQINDILNK